MPESNPTSPQTSQTNEPGPESTSSSLQSRAEKATSYLLAYLGVRAVILTVKGEKETVHVAACLPEVPRNEAVAMALDALDAARYLLRRLLTAKEEEEKPEHAERPTTDGEHAG